MAYVKPTLVEMYSELHLDAGALSEKSFFDVVPKLIDKGFSDVEFARGQLKLDLKGEVPLPQLQQRVRCWKQGRKQLAQVAEDLLVTNLVGHYPGWLAFLELFGETRSALIAGIGVEAFRSLALVTLDKFTVPKHEFVADRFLDAGGKVVPAWYRGCRESLDITLGKGHLESDGCNRQVHIKVRAAQDPVVVEFRVHLQRSAVGINAEQVLEQLHEESTETFESLITDGVRGGIMGGRK